MKNILFLMTLVVCLMSRQNLSAGSVTISWSPSGSPDVAGYYVYYGTTNSQLLNQIDVGNASSETLSNLPAGDTIYFAITAYDAFGDESLYSNQIKYIVPGILKIGADISRGASPVIQFPVAPGHWYQVQSASDLQNWQPIWQTGLAVSNIWMSFVDTNAANYSQRYYRVVSH